MIDPQPTDSGRPTTHPQPQQQPGEHHPSVQQQHQQPARKNPSSSSSPFEPGTNQTTTGSPAGAQAASSPADSADAAGESLAQVQAELATLKAKSGELADQYLRAKAEAENTRRRADDEVTKARKFAVESFAESLLPVLDSLEAGLAIKDATAQQFRSGSQATLQQLLSALERNKVSAIDPQPGEKFDPNRHHAISVAAASQQQQQQAPNSVVAVLQKGYTIADRVLRPALVTVSPSS